MAPPLDRGPSEALEVLDEIGFLLYAQPEVEAAVVVVHDGAEGAEAPVVVEAALRVRPGAAQRRRAVHAVGGAVGLERVGADVARLVHVPARLAERRRDVAVRAARLAGEERLDRK